MGKWEGQDRKQNQPGGGTGTVDYDEIVARREPRLCGSKVASNQESVISIVSLTPVSLTPRGALPSANSISLRPHEVRFTAVCSVHLIKSCQKTPVPSFDF